jgi:hypothetical protein
MFSIRCSRDLSPRGNASQASPDLTVTIAGAGPTSACLAII